MMAFYEAMILVRVLFFVIAVFAFASLALTLVQKIRWWLFERHLEDRLDDQARINAEKQFNKTLKGDK